jgi:putative transposase
MPEYRRSRVSGGTYFFTVNLRDRRSDLLVTEIGVLRETVREVRAARPFHIDAWVVLADHMHALWTLPQDDADFSGRWRDIKKCFVAHLPRMESRSVIQMRRGERGIWQRRFWEHTVRDARDYAAHMDYIHFNPVKHGYVATPGEWPYSSFRTCVMRGVYEADWVGAGDDDDSAHGERAER